MGYVEHVAFILISFKKLDLTTKTVLKADSFDYEGNFRVKWQCFGMASSVWRRYIGNGWETIIEEQQDMQERFKM